MPINREKVRAAAQKHLQKGQLDKAIKEFEQLVEDDPKDVRTLLKLGDLQTRAGENGAATKTYMQVAQFYSEQGFFLKAVAVYKQILKIDSSILEVNIKLADLYQQLGLLSDANTQFRHLAILFEQQNRIEECTGVLHKMIELDAENVAGRVKLAELYAKQNKIEDARREFVEAASIFKKQQRPDEWAKVAERMLVFCPSDIETTRALADIYIQKGDAKRALAKLQVCFKHDPKDTTTLELLGSAFKELGQLQKAVTVYKELARIYEERGDGRVIETTTKILELAPGDSEALQALARQNQHGDGLAESPKAAAANVTAIEFVEADLEDTMASSVITPADAEEAGEPRASADVSTDMAANGSMATQENGADPIAASPEETVSHLLVEAEIYIKYGLLKKAIDHVRKLLTLAPGSREAQEKHKLLLLETGDIPGAVAQLWDMAQGALDRDDETRACSDLEELLGIDPGHSRAQQLLRNLLPGPSSVPSAAAVDAALELEGDTIDLDVELASEEVPTVVLEGSTTTPGASYEPAAESADIDLDQDIKTHGKVDTKAQVEVEVEAGVAAGADTEADTEAELSADRQSVAAVALAPASFAPAGATRDDDEALPSPQSVARARVRPEVSKSLGLDDLDALLASAVPVRAKSSAEHTVDEPASPTTEGPAASVSVAASPASPRSSAPSAADTIYEPTSRTAEAPVAPLSAAVSLESPRLPPSADDEGETLPAAEIEEIRFFLQQGLEDEARDALALLRQKYPAHREVDGLAHELDEVFTPSTVEVPTLAAPGSGVAVEQGAARSGELEPPMNTTALEPALVAVSQPASESGLVEASEPASEPAPVAASEPALAGASELARAPVAAAVAGDDSDFDEMRVERIDLADELESDFAAATVDADTDFQDSFSDVFDEFKRGVAEQVDDSDYETHYDLGIAYKEMGLLDDAIREFGIAARAPSREVVALTMIGTCYLERGDSAAAIKHWQQSLDSQRATVGEGMALRYGIARTCEAIGRLGDALKFYENVSACDPSYSDVNERISALRNEGTSVSDSTNELDELLADGVEGKPAVEAVGPKISYL